MKNNFSQALLIVWQSCFLSHRFSEMGELYYLVFHMFTFYSISFNIICIILLYAAENMLSCLIRLNIFHSPKLDVFNFPHKGCAYIIFKLPNIFNPRHDIHCKGNFSSIYTFYTCGNQYWSDPPNEANAHPLNYSVFHLKLICLTAHKKSLCSQK